MLASLDLCEAMSVREKIRMVCVALTVGPLAIDLAASAAEATIPHDQVTPVERFKAFLSTPPVVRALVFSERLPADLKVSGGTDIRTSRRFRYYEAIWQPNAYFLREVPDLDSNAEPPTPGLLAVQTGDECWFHFGRGYHKELIEYSAEHLNHVCHGAYLNSDVLRQVLAMGLMHTEVGSLEWHGDRFRAVGPTDSFHTEGELLTSANGFPELLRVTYTGTNGAVHWIVHYEFSSQPSSGGLPQTIHCSWLDGGREVERSEFHIYQLTTRQKPLAAGAFSPWRFVTNNAWQVLVYSNNAIYAALPGGGLKMIQDRGRAVGPRRRPGDPSPLRLFSVYAAWAGANLWILILAAKMGARRKQQKQTDTETKL